MEVVEVDRGQEVVGAATVGIVLGAIKRKFAKAEAGIRGSCGIGKRGVAGGGREERAS
jgi:hypothetical protein